MKSSNEFLPSQRIMRGTSIPSEDVITLSTLRITKGKVSGGSGVVPLVRSRASATLRPVRRASCADSTLDDNTPIDSGDAIPARFLTLCVEPRLLTTDDHSDVVGMMHW
jgi:hypothetical protein